MTEQEKDEFQRLNCAVSEMARGIRDYASENGKIMTWTIVQIIGRVSTLEKTLATLIERVARTSNSSITGEEAEQLIDKLQPKRDDLGSSGYSASHGLLDNALQQQPE